MSLYEAVAVILMGALGLLFAIMRGRGVNMPRIVAARLDVWAAIASPLLVAVVVVIGLVVLGAENLAGGAATGRYPGDHTTAIQNLFFGR